MITPLELQMIRDRAERDDEVVVIRLLDEILSLQRSIAEIEQERDDVQRRYFADIHEIKMESL